MTSHVEKVFDRTSLSMAHGIIDNQYLVSIPVLSSKLFNNFGTLEVC